MSVGPSSTVDLTLEPRRLLGLVTIVAALILLAGYGHEIAKDLAGTSLPHYLQRIDLNAELSVSAWFSSGLLAFIGLLCALVGMLRNNGAPRTLWGWRLLASGFVFLSLDEMVSIHEHLGAVIEIFGKPNGIFLYSWTVVGLVGVAAVALVFIPFVRHLPRPTAIRLVIAGAVYVGGALGMDMIEGVVISILGDGAASGALMCVEETMEVVGLLLGVRAMLLHIADVSPIRLTLQPSPTTVAAGAFQSPVNKPGTVSTASAH